MIALNAVSKYYPTPHGRKYALRDVSFTLPEKANVGVLGLNGSGKSTLLRLIGGIDFPNQGSIKATDSISWPLGLSGGVQASLTGSENAKFVCRVHGDDEHVIAEKMRFVADFSELGDYFEMPVKTYSSGMRSRLLFAISMAFDFDVYLIDEITAVGDARFREKSSAALREKRDKSNYIMVSHNVNELIKDSDVVLVLDNGAATLFNDVQVGLKHYTELVKTERIGH